MTDEPMTFSIPMTDYNTAAFRHHPVCVDTVTADPRIEKMRRGGDRLRPPKTPDPGKIVRNPDLPVPDYSDHKDHKVKTLQ
ncbi:hypothetical protein J6590_018612 [Homalodisca vitripennis]|nr:hypothetical protein J6590_018612 [Homalodisca vitripennis]